jgi:N-glycosylase/DNA lyase
VLDLDRCLFSGQVFRWCKDSDVYQGVDGQHWFEIDGDRARSNATETEFRALFNLNVDSQEIGRRLMNASPEMEPYLGSLQGLRIMQPSDPTEVFFSFLCTANNHLKRITPMVAKLADYGDPIAGTDFKCFPRADTVAGIPEEELRQKGFGYRGATIPYAAKEALARGGDAWIEGLRTVGYETAHNELVSIKGIGHKLADCICLYGLHYGEAVPIDTHMWQAACRVFFPQHQGLALTELRYREVGDFLRDRFGTLAGWAHLYLYYDNMLRGRHESDLV